MTRLLPILALLSLAFVASGCGSNESPAVPGAGAPCGNGQIDVREQCDDGNSVGGDGCSTVCRLEDGWSCESTPSVCTENDIGDSTCGDGIVEGIEGCDDFNFDDGDGCGADCRVEDGWVCAGEPSVCGLAPPEGCGDGIVDPEEACDDANTEPADGCSSDCTVEDGWVCQDEPSLCTEAAEAGCGNGLIEEGEECDDANTAADDGCSDACVVEPGYRCFGEPSVCEETPAECGDGLIEGEEECDDGNRITGDGCTRGCEVEDGWICNGEPSDCRRTEDICRGVDCSELNGICEFGVCDPATGDCVVQPADDGFGCDDGDPCTDGDECVLGACTGGLPTDCSELDSGCSIGVCDAGTGECVVEPLGEGDSCGDSTECSVGTCTAGECVLEPAADCTECGDGGGDFCAGGVCGGTGGGDTYDFEEGRGEFTDSGPAWVIATDRVHEGTQSVRSADIAASGTSGLLLEVELADAGAVTFWYSVSSESCCDGLRFFVDGTELQYWRGEIAYTSHTEPLAAGVHTLEWRYTKDGSVDTGSDAAWVDSITLTGVNACEETGCGVALFDGVECLTCPTVEPGGACVISDPNPCLAYSCDESGDCTGTAIEDGTSCDSSPDDCRTEVCEAGACVETRFDDCTACGDGGVCAGGECGGVGGEDGYDFEDGLDGFTASGPSWATATDRVHEGTQSARSATISHGGTTGMVLEVELDDPGSVSFWYSVSSESCCDGLRFFVDGVELQYWRGEVAFTEHTEALSEGVHTLEWRYTKDGSVNTGSDAAWVDDIRLEGVNACGSTICGVGIFDGVECIMCPVAPDGTDCDLDPGDCTIDSCLDGLCAPSPAEDFRSCDADETDCSEDFCLAGECVAELYEDCTSCGPTGSGLCASGECGGAGGSSAFDFESGSMAEELVPGGSLPWFATTDDARTGSYSARSGAVGTSQESRFTLDVELLEAGSISFWYRVSSESCCDGLDFSVDGVEGGDWRGTREWAEHTQDLAAGTHTLVWRYFKDGSVSTGDDSAWVDDIVIVGASGCESSECGVGVSDGETCIMCPIVPDGTECVGDNPCQTFECAAGTCAGTPVADGISCDSDGTDCLDERCVLGDCLLEALDDCSACGETGADLCMGGVCNGVGLDLLLDFEAGFPSELVGASDTNWELESADGAFGSASARNGDIDNSETSTMQMTVELESAGDVTFWYKTSTESTFDSLEFYIDDVLQDDWDGTIDWTEVTYALAAGTHTLRWTYDKDGSVSSGSDTVWVDQIQVTGGATCPASDECSPSLYDGLECGVCELPDGTECGDGSVCGGGVCL